MTKENIYYRDDNAFDRFYKRARYQANSFVAGKLGSKAADYLTTLPDFAYLICKLMLDPDVPFAAPADNDACKYCDFLDICRREIPF